MKMYMQTISSTREITDKLQINTQIKTFQIEDRKQICRIRGSPLWGVTVYIIHVKMRTDQYNGYNLNLKYAPLMGNYLKYRDEQLGCYLK